MKKILFAAILLVLIGFGAIFLTFREHIPPPDAVLINDALSTAMQSDNPIESARVLTDELTQAFAEMDAARQNRDRILQVFFSLFTLAFIALGVWFYLYCDRGILAPFRKLQGFAGRIAAGDLDASLEMDRHNLFGAFTESFDLMREELHIARESERRANQSKKELVASLSHDIKTPVASIKAVTELMLLKAADEKESERLHTIAAKAEQINALITDMFHATLEELQALPVSPVEVQSTQLPDLIREADYKGRIKPFSIPNCIVLADPLRLQQVFDNLISNAYKYADTEMEIAASFEARHLVIALKDFGAGVPEEELPLLMHKFYRGKQAEHSSGYGLGLFISAYFMEQMSGGLSCENQPDGFVVKISLPLV